MTGWLLDTNVLSELRRPRPERKVLAFIAAQPLEHLYVSAVTFAEIRFGIELVTDAGRRAELNDWLALKVRPMFEQRARAITEDIMFKWRLLVEEGRKAGPTFSQPDLIIAATESSDGYTGTTPVQVAELLGLPSVTFAKSVTVDGQTVKVERQTESGFDEVTSPLPALVTVTAGVVEPRYPSFKGIMAAKSKPVDTLTVADLGLDASTVGAAGAGQEITDVAEAESRSSGEIVVDEGDGAARIVAFLETLKVI